MKPTHKLNKLQLLIVDGAGTLFDPCSLIPAYAFRSVFQKKGLDIDLDIIVKYMGRPKKEHLMLLFNEPLVLEQFQNKYNRSPNKKDIKAFYLKFKKSLYSAASKTEEIKGVKKAAYKLKERGIPMIMTTGYDKKMFKKTKKVLPWLDDILLKGITSSDVKKGRPSPLMICNAMWSISLMNPSYAVKVGDTEVDVLAADNAHVPGIFVTSGSISYKEAVEINKRLDRKHLILPSLVEVIDSILDETLADKINELNNYGN